MNSPLDDRQQQSAEQFHRQAASYGRSHILADTRDVAELLARIPHKGGAALDVATGGGHCALALARAGYKVTAGDLAPAMLDGAQRLLTEEGFPLLIALFPAELLPFPDGSAKEGFALVSSRVAPHHFSDVAAFVSESHRVMKSGGYLMIIDGSVPDNDPETSAWLHEVEKLRDPSHGRLLARAEWTALVEEAGFAIEHAALQPMVQPDLEWYFKAAATPEENRSQVRQMVRYATPHVRQAMQLTDEGGRVSWVWQRLSLLARKA